MDASLAASIDLQGIQSLFSDALPSVQEIASFKVAISLWYSFLFSDELDEDELGDSLNEKYRGEVEKSLQLLSAPHLIKDQVRSCLLKVENEFDNWICYTKYETLPVGQLIVRRSYLKCCVWQSGGKIDYKKSAVKMLSLDDLSSEEKFGIMCKYCMEDEIKNMVISAELETYFEAFEPGICTLTNYWICYLRNDLHGVVPDETVESVDSYMITRMEVDNWFAIEYFWNRLNEHEQIAKATLLLIKHFTVRFQKRLLAKMNEFQLRQLFTNIPVIIIVNFWVSLGEPETALMVWNRLKNSLSGEQFSTLVDKVFDERIYLEDYIPFMVRLWNSAGNRHKSYLLQIKRDFIIKHYFTPNFCSLAHSVKFLSAMLSYGSPAYRLNLMMEYGHNLAVSNHFSEVDKVIKLCLPVDDQVVKFKKKILESSVVRDHCNRLFENGEFEYLNKFVEFYSLDESTAVQFKKQVLESNSVDSVFIFKPSAWYELEKLVDHVHSDKTIATDAKKRLILCSGMNCFYDWSNGELLRQLIEVVTRFLTEEEMVDLKATLKGKFRDVLKDGGYWESFDETYWKEFLTWCLGSEQNIEEFKQSLPFEEIFNDIMEIMVNQYIYEDDFREGMLSVMDKFLTWFLVEPQKVKEYKLSRVFDFKNVELIEASIARKEEHYTKIVLAWFLDNDEEQICRFRAEFSHEKVSKII